MTSQETKQLVKTGGATVRHRGTPCSSYRRSNHIAGRVWTCHNCRGEIAASQPYVRETVFDGPEFTTMHTCWECALGEGIHFADREPPLPALLTPAEQAKANDLAWLETVHKRQRGVIREYHELRARVLITTPTPTP